MIQFCLLSRLLLHCLFSFLPVYFPLLPYFRLYRNVLLLLFHLQVFFVLVLLLLYPLHSLHLFVFLVLFHYVLLLLFLVEVLLIFLLLQMFFLLLLLQAIFLRLYMYAAPTPKAIKLSEFGILFIISALNPLLKN